MLYRNQEGTKKGDTRRYHREVESVTFYLVTPEG